MHKYFELDFVMHLAMKLLKDTCKFFKLQCNSFFGIGSILRRLIYGSVAGLSCAALCYPQFTVNLTRQGAESVKEKWGEFRVDELKNGNWPFVKGKSFHVSCLKIKSNQPLLFFILLFFSLPPS